MYAKKNLLERNFLSAIGLFSLFYAGILWKSYHSESELKRIAAAGSLTFILCELAFYPLDVINMQQKTFTNQNISSRQMFRSVFNHYGPYGIYRGFSGSYYSTLTAGYVFFALYKGIKIELRDKLKPKTQSQCSMIYFASSIIAEALSMLIYYPYEIFKIRYVAKNDKYRYNGVTDCFRKIMK